MMSVEPHIGNDQLHGSDAKEIIISNITHSTLHTQNTFTFSKILHKLKKKQALLYVQQFYHEKHVFFEFHSFFMSRIL